MFCHSGHGIMEADFSGGTGMGDSFLNLAEEDLAQEHLCCIIRSKKPHPGVEAKRDWLAQRLKEGHVFRKLDAKGAVFIEDAPLETAWVPVEGGRTIFTSTACGSPANSRARAMEKPWWISSSKPTQDSMRHCRWALGTVPPPSRFTRPAAFAGIIWSRTFSPTTTTIPSMNAVFSWWTWYICKENYKNVECLLRHSTFFNIRDAYSFRLSTQVFSSASLSLPLSIRPSMILAPGALERSPEADLPRPLPPEVAKRTMVLPVKS